MQSMMTSTYNQQPVSSTFLFAFLGSVVCIYIIENVDIYNIYFFINDSNYHIIYAILLHFSTIFSRSSFTNFYVLMYATLYLLDGFKFFEMEKEYILSSSKQLNKIQLCIAFTIYNYIVYNLFFITEKFLLLMKLS